MTRRIISRTYNKRLIRNDDKILYVVSGFMRTGTSMMMKALEAGGLKVKYKQSREEMRKSFADKYYDPNITQTAMTVTTLSGANIINTGDHTTSGAAYVAGVITDTAATPPTASNFPQGTIYLQYTA